MNDTTDLRRLAEAATAWYDETLPSRTNHGKDFDFDAYRMAAGNMRKVFAALLAERDALLARNENLQQTVAFLDSMRATWRRRAGLLLHYLNVIRDESYQKQVRIEQLEWRRDRAQDERDALLAVAEAAREHLRLEREPTYGWIAEHREAVEQEERRLHAWSALRAALAALDALGGER